MRRLAFETADGWLMASEHGVDIYSVDGDDYVQLFLPWPELAAMLAERAPSAVDPDAGAASPAP